jgi:hypothetical protein
VDAATLAGVGEQDSHLALPPLPRLRAPGRAATRHVGGLAIGLRSASR